MRVLSVEMRDFRTYARAEARLGEGLTVVHGPNGAGKSNLLEALYFGCTGRSPRTRNERELIRFGAGAARVVVHLSDGGRPARADGRLRQRRRRRAAGQAHDRATAPRWSGCSTSQSRPLVSVFLPDRLELLKGPPALRRAHLDQVVAAIWPLRAQTPHGVLARARAAQRAARADPRRARLAGDAVHVGPRAGGQGARPAREPRAGRGAARRARSRSARESSAAAASRTLEYRPRSRAADEDQFVAELRRAAGRRPRAGLHRARTAPRRAGASCDEGRELRVYGSQGEQRLALLALLLAERAVLARERGRTPLMLLDDVMSELDGERRELLAAELRAERAERDRDDRPLPRARRGRRRRHPPAHLPGGRSCRRPGRHEPRSPTGDRDRAR